MTPFLPDHDETLLKKSNQILYLTLEARKDTLSGSINIDIVQYQISDGKMKFIDQNHTTKETNGRWRISLLDARERILISRYINNPFILNRESFSESGHIEQKIIHVCQTQIPLRFPFLQQMKKIQIDTLALSGNEKQIFLQHIADKKP